MGKSRFSHKHLALGQEYIDEEEQHIAQEMVQVIKRIMQQRYEHEKQQVTTSSGQLIRKPFMRRFNQSKTIALLKGTFDVLPNLPDTLAQGVFAQPAKYPCVIRIASATEDDDRRPDFLGFSIKLYQVPGKKLWGFGDQQDFILNSYPVLFAGNPQDFLDFVRATEQDKRWQYFINQQKIRLNSLQTILFGKRLQIDPFLQSYWSTTPYRLGDFEHIAVKYKITPKRSLKDYRFTWPHKDYFSDMIANHLDRENMKFEFGIQFQLDAERMPIEDASQLWSEQSSMFYPTAQITITQQDFQSTERLTEAEQITFNPWQSLHEHRPLGGINRVRNRIYAELSEHRNKTNAKLRLNE